MSSSLADSEEDNERADSAGPSSVVPSRPNNFSLKLVDIDSIQPIYEIIKALNDASHLAPTEASPHSLISLALHFCSGRTAGFDKKLLCSDPDKLNGLYQDDDRRDVVLKLIGTACQLCLADRWVTGLSVLERCLQMDSDKVDVSSESIDEEDKSSYEAVCIDCEMVGLGEKGYRNMLAHVAVVDENGSCLVDRYVLPADRVTDYRTWMTGITCSQLAECGGSFEEVRSEVLRVLRRSKLLVGHDLKNDLKSLCVFWPAELVRDTMLCALQLGVARCNLKALADEFLSEEIQSADGIHCPLEDAKATMKLYQLWKDKWPEKAFPQKSSPSCLERLPNKKKKRKRKQAEKPTTPAPPQPQQLPPPFHQPIGFHPFSRAWTRARARGQGWNRGRRGTFERTRYPQHFY